MKLGVDEDACVKLIIKLVKKLQRPCSDIHVFYTLRGRFRRVR